MDQRAIDLLRRNGWDPGETVGSGAEGTVVALDQTTVAKLWHGRSVADLEQLQRFTAAVARLGLPFGTPEVIDTFTGDDQLVTVERRLTGRPLRSRQDDPPPVTEADGMILGEVLAGFAAARVRAEDSTDLAVLPVLPGQPAFDPDRPFRRSLADLVERRLAGSAALLRRTIDDVDDLVRSLTARLRAGDDEPPARLMHGDLVPGNVLVEGGRPSAVLDFGFFTTLGDPAFEAAITASIFDMYGPHARASEDVLSRTFSSRFDHDPELYDCYRAAYAVATSTCFTEDGSDGHFAWCARMLARPEVRAATGID